MRRFFSDAVQSGFDWRVDGWTKPNCIALSMILLGWNPEPEGEPLEFDEWEKAKADAPRQNYSLHADGTSIELRLSYDRPGCTDDQF